MTKILWILNKYIGNEKEHEFFTNFLSETQIELQKKGYELNFIFFSDLLSSDKSLTNKFVYDELNFSHLSAEELEIEANRIERVYEFTLKQAYFSDIIQTFKPRNYRKITIPKNEFKDLDFLIPRFLFLEHIIKSKNIDVIFSDVSPEAEMEFGRVIGNKLNKIVLKTTEGSALGKTVIQRALKFGKYQLVEPQMNLFTEDEAKKFCNEFIENRQLPYKWPERNSYIKSIKNRVANRIKKKEYLYFLKWLLDGIRNKLLQFSYLLERKLLKPLLYDSFDPSVPYLFIGFHLNQESTMALRAQPYTNQTVLVEMISRLLPHNHTLYVRAHPHWPDTYSYSYLSKMKKFPGVKIISDKISVHDIIKDSKGILTYTATTGIEALIYNKPVLSFASNIYIQHPAVNYCEDLYKLGEKLTKVINTKVRKKDTISFIAKMNTVSIDFLLGADCFSSILDTEVKATTFSDFLHKSIMWCSENEN